MNGIIELEGMEFHACHGCFEEERKTGNTFTVDFKGWTDMSRAAESDRLEDIVDYGKVYETVKREMEIPSDLIENVAGRIVRAIESGFPEFRKFSIRVSKKNPPVPGQCAWSRVTLCGGSAVNIDKEDFHI